MPLKTTLAKRLFFGSVMIVILIGLLVIEGWLATRHYFGLPESLQAVGFGMVVTMIAVLGCVELHQIAKIKGLNPTLWINIVVVIVIVTQKFWMALFFPFEVHQLCQYMLWVIVVLMFLAAIVQAREKGIENTLIHLGLTCFNMIYLGLGCWFLVLIRLVGSSQESIWGQIGPISMFLLCVKSADIGAYFTGRQFGRHKWVPGISPNKTWEGFFGGIFLAMIVSSLFYFLFAIIDGVEISFSATLFFGMVVAVSGQLGDLLESMLKRDAGSKDSASIIPAFGGVLDLIDSVVVAAPFAYIILEFTYYQ